MGMMPTPCFDECTKHRNCSMKSCHDILMLQGVRCRTLSRPRGTMVEPVSCCERIAQGCILFDCCGPIGSWPAGKLTAQIALMAPCCCRIAKIWRKRGPRMSLHRGPESVVSKQTTKTGHQLACAKPRCQCDLAGVTWSA